MRLSNSAVRRHDFSQTRLRGLAACFARGLPSMFRPLQSEGAGNAGCALHPRSRVQNAQKKAHTSIQVQRRQSDIPRAMVYGLYVLSPVIGLLTPSLAKNSASLTPASRRQDHTTSPSARRALVRSTARVHRIPLRVCDVRETPLCWNGTAVDIQVIWVFGKTEYFFKRGWTCL